MVTLLTCHPYRGHGRYRYVVYCMRNHGQKIRKQRKIDKIDGEEDVMKNAKRSWKENERS